MLQNVLILNKTTIISVHGVVGSIAFGDIIGQMDGYQARRVQKFNFPDSCSESGKISTVSKMFTNTICLKLWDLTLHSIFIYAIQCLIACQYLPTLSISRDERGTP